VCERNAAAGYVDTVHLTQPFSGREHLVVVTLGYENDPLRPIQVVNSTFEKFFESLLP